MAERPKPLSVYDLTLLIKGQLESAFPDLLVEGEISNYIDHASGHIYFTLKDDKSQVRCTLWKWARKHLRFTPEDGMKVRILGEVRVYEKAGSYQLNVKALEPSGIGALQLAFEQLKERLGKEGLFDAGRKRPMPVFPARIGIVTSESGAALRDIIKVARRRMPSCALVLNPALVQGEGAAQDIARAIREFNAYGNVDLLIVGRGGGSLEDLWAFNEEAVARAIAESVIPVVSAVGHEVDTTIADYVADLRAPTPSAAVEMVLPSRDDLIVRVKSLADAVASSLRGTVNAYRERLQRLIMSRVLTRPQEILAPLVQRLDDLGRFMELHMERLLDQARHRLSAASGKLDLLSPLGVLARGYSITRREGAVTTDAAVFRPGDELETVLAKGRVKSRVEQIIPPAPSI
ncbi:MAG: exodeoxyribonuclease VII large subunit [Fibrobacterota bacterium]